MPEIHIINGQPRECSDAVRARGLIEEWLADPDTTDAKIAKVLADEAEQRTRDRASNQIAKGANTSSGPIPPRRPRPEKE